MKAMFYLPMMIGLGMVFLLPMTSKRSRARLVRDPVEAIMFGVAAILTFALLVSAAIVAQTHNVAILKVVILAAGAFAIVGIGVGLFRSLRTAKKPIA